MVVCALGGDKDLKIFLHKQTANLKMVVEDITYWVFMMSTLSDLQKPKEVGAVIVFVVNEEMSRITPAAELEYEPTLVSFKDLCKPCQRRAHSCENLTCKCLQIYVSW